MTAIRLKPAIIPAISKSADGFYKYSTSSPILDIDTSIEIESYLLPMNRDIYFQ